MSIFEEAGLPDPSPVMAATKWRNNSDMILDVKRLVLIRDDDLILDPTYQDGTWWLNWRPEKLVTNSLDPANGADLCFDFRNAPFRDDTFDCIAYDPPYVSKGGRDTTTLEDHQRRYGIGDAPKSPAALQDLINDGLTEMARVLGSGGTLLVKCQDYVSSGKVWWGSMHTWNHAVDELKLIPVDRFYFLNSGSAQPERKKMCSDCHGYGWVASPDPRTGEPINEQPCRSCDETGLVLSKQQHARQNVSHLFIFRKSF